jgi:hypothetical protein
MDRYKKQAEQVYLRQPVIMPTRLELVDAFPDMFAGNMDLPLKEAPQPKAVEVPVTGKDGRPKPVATDFAFSFIRFPSCCSAGIIHGFRLAGAASFYGKESDKDWSLPLDEKFIVGIRDRFDAFGTNLTCTTVPLSKELMATSSGSYYELSAPALEYILEHTGWLKGELMMGCHGWPIQLWVRPFTNGKMKQV